MCCSQVLCVRGASPCGCVCVHFNIPWREERGGTVGVSRHLGWWNLSTAEPHPLFEECCSTTTTLTTDKGQISSHLHRKHIIGRCVCVYGCVTKIIRIVNYYCRNCSGKENNINRWLQVISIDISGWHPSFNTVENNSFLCYTDQVRA